MSMSINGQKKIVQQFVEAVNRGDMEIVNQVIDRDFYNYAPAAGEETAPEVVRQILLDLRTAFPDFKMHVEDFVDVGERLTFRMTMSGTHTKGLWGAPGKGNHIKWTSTVTSRFSNGKFAFQWKDLPPQEVVSKLREIDLVPPPEDMDKPLKYPIALPEILLKVLFTGQVGDKDCSHLDLIQVVQPDTDVCQDCVAQGDVWPALRMCLICGYVGCCDTAKNKHAKKHYEETGHLLIRSIRLEESWVWCYEDSAFFSGKILEKYR